MLILLISFITLFIGAIIVFKICDDRFDSDVLYFLSIIAIIISFIGLIVIGILGYYWQSAKVKVNIINREYKTEYTAEEIFYAEDIIDTIREIQRQRIEVNGNIMDKK